MTKMRGPYVLCCERLRDFAADPDIPIVFVDKFREFGISVLNGGTGYILIEYCPWCGKKLPSSLREKWVAKIRKLGLEPGDARIPEELLDDRWYRETKMRRSPSSAAAVQKSKAKRARR